MSLLANACLSSQIAIVMPAVVPLWKVISRPPRRQTTPDPQGSGFSHVEAIYVEAIRYPGLVIPGPWRGTIESHGRHPPQSSSRPSEFSHAVVAARSPNP